MELDSLCLMGLEYLCPLQKESRFHHQVLRKALGREAKGSRRTHDHDRAVGLVLVLLQVHVDSHWDRLRGQEILRLADMKVLALRRLVRLIPLECFQKAERMGRSTLPRWRR